jgi:iron complex transport system ATP-binding protein
MSDERMIKIDDIRFSYGDYEALKGLNIEGTKGQFIGLLGPNGSGKSTLLRCINGILRPHLGTIFVDGKDVSKLKLSELAQICGNVPTEFPDDFNLTVQDLVFMGRYPYVEGLWWEKRDDEEIVMKALRDFNVFDLKDRRISEISSGEKQRTLLAKAVVQTPKVMLVDEPNAHLDLKYKLETMEYLRSLVDKDMSIIVASHDINLLVKYCDKVIVLSQGKIVDYGEPNEIITVEMIQRVYGVVAEVHRNNGNIFILPKTTVKSEN